MRRLTTLRALPFLAATVLLLISPVSARAQGTTCPSELQYDVDHPDVNRCWGNCGVDCSTDINMGCQVGWNGWTHDFWGPMEEMYYVGSKEYCDGEYRCTSSCSKHRTPGEFSYHGTWSSGCHTHDTWCREGDWNGCYAPSPNFLANICNGERANTWTYQGYVYSIDITDTECVYDWPRCPEIYGDDAPRLSQTEVDDTVRRLMAGEIVQEETVDRASKALLARKPLAPPMAPGGGLSR